MARDLNLPIEIIICPIVRELDGLAMSSRNTYLNSEERRAATVLYRGLTAAREAFEVGERNAERLRNIVAQTVADEPLVDLQYVSCADPGTLQELETVTDRALLSMAAFAGTTRLIDNVVLGE
jgi:pantoate--beta-alanine ligase